MFRKNEEYKQYDIFGVTNALSEKQSKLLSNSIEHSFFENIFSNISESDFEVLYSDKKSRPNVPVNQLVGSLILKHLFNWTYEALFRNINFNILTRHAIGIQTINESVFSEASIYNFQNKIIGYYIETGKDLLTEVFDKLTASQLKEYGIKSNIQRGDSFLIGSNIFDYTRIQLLIEVLLRLYRILDEQDKHQCSEVLQDYIKQTAGQYIYKLSKENLPKEIKQLAGIYHKMFISYKDKYNDVAVFNIFERVYYEHFTVLEDKADAIAANELNSSILMSPDDQEATYRNKRRKDSKGYSGHISETANPENELNLITDIAVVPNNIDDAKLLEGRLPEMIDKTPDLSEYHTDGGYGSPSVDILMEAHEIKQIQTSVRGRKAFAKMEIKEFATGEYCVTCEHGQTVKATKATKGKNAKRLRAVFDYNKCSQCPLNTKCKSRVSGVKIQRPKRTWYFSKEKIRLHKRKQNHNTLPPERQTLRANVEATVKEVKRGIKDGKVRVRGQQKVMIYLSMTSIAVNLTRIHKYLEPKPYNCTSIMKYKRIIKLLLDKMDPILSSKTQFSNYYS
jgi:hypothetical protein